MKSNPKLSINAPLIKLLTKIIFSLALIFSAFAQILAQEATGGDEIYEIEENGKIYKIHKFTSVGNYQFIANKNLKIDALIIAGGGSGGGGYGGGGGAGGLIFNSNYLVYKNQIMAVVVGSGGSSPCGTMGINGNNSQFGNLIANGGGGGSGRNWVSGRNGGSGGGSGNSIPGMGTEGQGSNGGIVSNTLLGGGGGAGNVGGVRSGGDGINTLTNFLTTANAGVIINGARWIAGGGGGGAHTGSGTGIGGKGGGGNSGLAGGCRNGNSGIANTGSGGGGGTSMNAAQCGYGACGGTGGSGIVIIRYEISQFNLNISNGDQDITPTKTSPQFTLSGTIDYPDDGDATSVAVSATIGGIERQYVVNIGEERENLPWHLTWTHDELSEGEYTNIEFTASDGIEETSANYTGKIIIDKTAPVCGTWNPPISNWRPRSSKSFTLSGSTDVGGSGIDIGGGVCNTGPNHGDKCVLEIKDKAGNTTLCPSPVNNIDIFPPQLQVTPPLPGWQGNKQSIIIEPIDDKTGIKRTAYSWLVNNLGADCNGGDTYNPGDDLRLTIMGGENTLYVCTIDNAGNTTFSSQIYRYIPPMLATPTLHKNVKPSNLYWNIESISETQSYVEIKGFFPKTKGNYNYALELIIPTINKSYSQALQTSPFSETHFTILIPTSDFNASKDNHTFSGPQKLKITDLDEMESTTTDLNLTFFFPIHQSNHRKDFNYFILAGDNRLNEVGE